MRPSLFEDELLTTLAKLSDRSLILSNRSGSLTRYSTLETIRQFTERTLKRDGLWSSVRRRHRDLFLAFAERAEIGPANPQEAEWFKRLEVEHDNLRVALDWSIESGHADASIRFALSLGRFWDTYGHLREGRGRVSAILQRFARTASAEKVANLQIYAGWMAVAQRDAQSACEHFKQSLDTVIKYGDPLRVGHVHNALGIALTMGGDYEAGEEQYDKALEVVKKFNHVRGHATVLNNLGELALVTGNRKMARERLNLALSVETESRETRGQILGNLSMLEYLEGRYSDAQRLAGQALQTFYQASVTVNYPLAFGYLGISETRIGHFERGGILLGACEFLAETAGVLLPRLLEEQIYNVKQELTTEVGNVGLEDLFERARVLSLDHLLQFALGGS